MTRAVTSGGPAACRAGHGACWPFLAAKLEFMIFGVFPYDEQWRPLTALLIFIGACAVSMHPRFWSRKLIPLWLFVCVAYGVLMYV